MHWNLSNQLVIMIKQCYFSECLELFRKGFFDLWKLDSYNNNVEPCVFAGVYSLKDIDVINAHKGFKVVLICGADHSNIPALNSCNFIIEDISMRQILATYGIMQPPIIAMRDFSEYKPTLLGSKIYCYIRSESSKNYFCYKVIEELIGIIGREHFIIAQTGRPKEQVIEDYKNSFVSIQLNPIAGNTSSKELAHMGRYCISNNTEKFNINYKSVKDIVNAVTRLRSLVGQYDYHVAELARDSINYSRNWLETDFYDLNTFCRPKLYKRAILKYRIRAFIKNYIPFSKVLYKRVKKCWLAKSGQRAK